MVRNIIAHANDSQTETECIAVFYNRHAVYAVKKTIPGSIEATFIKAHGVLHKLFEKLETKNNLLKSESDNTKPRALNRVKISLIQILIFCIRSARYLFKRLRNFAALHDRGEPIEILDDDIIVMLDASWRKDSFALVSNAKLRGSTVVCVIHDLIPVTHPHLFNEQLVKEYNIWLDWIAKTADGYMAISKTICDQARSLMKGRLTSQDFNQRWFDFFYHGSELDLLNETVARETVKSIFDVSSSIYLMVSTIEPRKNLDYLLDAFNELWGRDQNIILCIIGHIGWKCEALLNRIYSHPRLNKQLFMLNDISDAELEYAYQHSKALVFSSIEEGFGLPIVEAMQRGLPVMASDIPVFHEVGGDFCAYFKLDDHHTLFELVRQFESTGKFPSAKHLKDFQWQTWRQATASFLMTIRKHITKE